MPHSFKSQLKKLCHDGKITNEKYEDLIKKLDGHDKRIKENTIDTFIKYLHSYCNENSWFFIIANDIKETMLTSEQLRLGMVSSYHNEDEEEKIEKTIQSIQYRIDTASRYVGNGVDGKSFEDLEYAINILKCRKNCKYKRNIKDDDMINTLKYMYDNLDSIYKSEELDKTFVEIVGIIKERKDNRI